MIKNHNFKNKKMYRSGKKRLIIAGVLTFIIGTAVINVFMPSYFKTSTFQASIINLEMAEPFNGTTSPIKEIPNWAKLTEEERKLAYNQLNKSRIIAIPSYNPEKLVVVATVYPYNSAEYNDLVNQQITYSVPYLGNYKLEGVEGSGSHPAVDIKIPMATPVFAIANGVVTKATISDGGFGNHITIGHFNFPSYEDKNKKETIYSTYAHLSSLLVSVGEIVKKDQQIGLSGESGIATTPHLHFQIDKDTAPFKPYWPFTGTEAQKAGYNFFQAINNGLGIENAKLYTINPLKYVQKYVASEESIETTNTEIEEQPKDPIENKDTVKPDTETKPEENKPIETKPVAEENPSNFAGFKILNDGYYVAGSPVLISIKTINESSEIVGSPILTEDVKISITPSEIELGKTYLSQKDFNNGESIISFQPEDAGKLVITLTYKNKDYKSDEIIIVAKIKQPTAFKIETEKYFIVDQAEKIIIKTLDEEGKVTPSITGLGEVRLEAVNGIGSFSPEVLQESDFKQGAAIINFTGESMESVKIKAESSKFRVVSDEIKAKVFEDIEPTNKNALAILTLKKRGIISGYPDNTFKELQDVSRVESLKIALKATKKDLVADANLNFSDVELNAWYTPYIATGQNLKIVQGYPDNTFKPGNTVTRVEFFKMLFQAFGINVDPVITEKTYDDVGSLEWYAPYAQLIKKMNLLEVEGNKLEPNKPMNRGEIAQAIYRLLYVKENNVDSYKPL